MVGTREDVAPEHAWRRWKRRTCQRTFPLAPTGRRPHQRRRSDTCDQHGLGDRSRRLQIRFDKATLALGRQPVDFGSGRLWQPLNVFGAFAPTDLDTDFKPGIDAAVLTAYPSAFSSLSAVVALAPHGQSAIDNSAALHYQRQVGETSQLALLAARVVGQQQFGASFESDWRGVGWRVEGLHTRPQGRGPGSLFWILGADYQFGNGTLVALEWHDDARGAIREEALAGVATTRPVLLGLQQQLARRVLGLSLQKDLTPLWNASYTVLATRCARRRAGMRRPCCTSSVWCVRSATSPTCCWRYQSAVARDWARRDWRARLSATFPAQ